MRSKYHLSISGCVCSHHTHAFIPQNERFYGHPATPQEILFGGFVETPEGKGIEDLHKKLEIMRRGETCVTSEEDRERNEMLKLEANRAGKEAKAVQGAEVEHVVAEDIAAMDG